MYNKRLIPYIKEFITFLAIAMGLFIFFTVTDSIVFRWSPVLVLFAIMLMMWLAQYVFTFIPFAILVTSDLILKNYSTTNAKFVEQFVFKSSSFLDKNEEYRKGRKIERVETLYYKVVVKTQDGIKVFTSSEYFKMESGKTYEFVFGRKSKALVDVKVM